MTSIVNPPPPSAPEPPTTNDDNIMNKGVDHWFYTVGVNCVPAVTKGKTGKKGFEWKIWQYKPIPEELFEKWKSENAFADGVAVIPGKIWRGPIKERNPNQDIYLTFVDLDNSIAITEFCTRNGVKTSLEVIAGTYIVEQHRDDLSKAHIYFLSETPFPKRSSDTNDPNFKPEEQPAFEIKGEGGHGIAYATPSMHQNGHRYEIIGTNTPIILSKAAAEEMILHLDSICKKYKLKYLENDDGNGKALIPMEELKKPGFVIYGGNNRHEALMRYIESQIKTKYGRWTWSEFKQDAYYWNQVCCKPPLDDIEFEKQWDSACGFIIPKIEEELDKIEGEIVVVVEEEEDDSNSKKQEQQQEEKKTVSSKLPPKPQIPIAWENDYFEFLIVQAQKQVKEENALIRQIYLNTLSANSDDPQNLGVMAPTASGKSYPMQQCIKFTPTGKEIRIVGSMSPKVLVRERGVLVDKNRKPIARQVKKLKADIKKANAKKQYDDVAVLQEQLEQLLDGAAYIVDLSNVTLLFLEPPDPDFWNLMKPILSHDFWEMEHPYVDNMGHGIEVKKIITRGWPSCIFCSAKDESKWDIWPEIESRFMISSPNMIKAKYEAGNKLTAQKKWLPKAVKQKLIISDEDVQLAKDCYEYLKCQAQQYRQKTESPVWAPFGELLGAIFPADKGQDNRAFNRFSSQLNILTLCKAHLRYKLILGDEELVISSLRDLHETLHIMQNMTGVPPHKLKLYQDYILPLWVQQGCAPLKTKQIVDYYNAKNKLDNKGVQPMNSDNLRKNYLQELVNHNYLEQEQDPDTKKQQYQYTPLILGGKAEEEAEEEQSKPEEEKSIATVPTLEGIFKNLQYSKLILPKSIGEIPSDWLKQQFLQNSALLLTDAKPKILSPKATR